MEPRSFNRGDLFIFWGMANADRASMEPRSFNRGDGLPCKYPYRYGLLQWSHGRLTVVTVMTRKTYHMVSLLQWSHGRLTVVTMDGSVIMALVLVLQWSHGRLTVVTVRS